jgi:hypothetical protein
MTALSRPAFGPGRLGRLGRLIIDTSIGTLLCTGPVSAVIALGWLARRSGHHARDRFGAAEEAPGWLFGAREYNGRSAGRIARMLGGLGANIRSGLMALTALLVWTLPFTLLWLGAWWAGWENSFNKGYEQAFVGPSVFLFGVLGAAAVLPVLPLMFAHLGTEDRFSAAFELRRLRSVVAQAGWHIPALSILTTLCALPFAAARGLVTTATDTWPALEEMSPDQIAEIKVQIALALAAISFVSAWLVRSLAARIYSRAAARASGLKPGLWDGAQASEGAIAATRRSPVILMLWYGLAVAPSFGLCFLILVGQFLDHAWWRWLFHPALTLPWAG